MIIINDCIKLLIVGFFSALNIYMANRNNKKEIVELEGSINKLDGTLETTRDQLKPLGKLRRKRLSNNITLLISLLIWFSCFTFSKLESEYLNGFIYLIGACTVLYTTNKNRKIFSIENNALLEYLKTSLIKANENLFISKKDFLNMEDAYKIARENYKISINELSKLKKTENRLNEKVTFYDSMMFDLIKDSKIELSGHTYYVVFRDENGKFTKQKDIQDKLHKDYIEDHRTKK